MSTNYIAIDHRNIFTYPDKENAFSPSKKYPEYPFDSNIVGEENNIYDMVRQTLYLMGYDREHYGTKEWNPLGDFISLGQTVLIKPNMVLHFNKGGGDTDCVITNPSVVRAICDYVIIALGGKGKIIIADAPVNGCNFEKLFENSGYSEIKKFYEKNVTENIEIQFCDLRSIIHIDSEQIVRPASSDNEKIIVNLGKKSYFYGLDEKRMQKLRVTSYDPKVMRKHHNNAVHEYAIAKIALEADVIINMPKPKTHRKAGVTISLKNFVGANTNKEFLPHHTLGSKDTGGDEYMKKDCLHYLHSRGKDYKNIKKYGISNPINSIMEKINRAAVKCIVFFRRGRRYLNRHLLHTETDIHNPDYIEGSWWGNDTIWRTVLDLNKILYFADKSGIVQEREQRKVLIVADMIISGEKEGPMEPSPKDCGIIALGDNPYEFDRIVCSLMGFDYRLIPTINNSSSIFETKEPYKIVSNDSKLNGKTWDKLDKDNIYNFMPSSGWLPLINSYIKKSED